MKEEIRRRAYELFCRRGGQPGSELEDWLHAEREHRASLLAGLAEEDRDIRITACVAGAVSAELGVDVLPDEIVVEVDHERHMDRYQRFHLPAPVDARRVRAKLRGMELDVVAPKKKKK